MLGLTSSSQPPHPYQQVNPTFSIDYPEDRLRQLQMQKHSQRNIQNQIDNLTQQTTAAGWYNTQLATGLPSGRPNSAVRTIATTPGLPLELEMIVGAWELPTSRTRPYISVPTCSTCGYTGHDRYECPYIAFGFNAPRLPTTVA